MTPRVWLKNFLEGCSVERWIGRKELKEEYCEDKSNVRNWSLCNSTERQTLLGDSRGGLEIFLFQQKHNASHICHFKFSSSHIKNSKSKQIKLILVIHFI